MPDEIQKLIDYRIDQAYKAIDDVALLIDNKLYQVAINRIYYGMFYCLLALALKYDYKTSKHNQLIGWFNKEFVKEGKIDKNLGRIVHKAFEDRSDGDYGVFIEFEEVDTRRKFDDMKRFVSELSKFINKNDKT